MQVPIVGIHAEQKILPAAEQIRAGRKGVQNQLHVGVNGLAQPKRITCAGVNNILFQHGQRNRIAWGQRSDLRGPQGHRSRDRTGTIGRRGIRLLEI
jgi:hypothetical protein